MDTRLWQQIQELFDRAVELPAEDRAAFVERETEDRSVLRSELSALLVAWEDDPEYLERESGPLGVALVAPDPTAASSDPLLGASVGAWRILHRLGEGGMGVVYLAERTDGAFAQKVAIKVVRRGLDTDHLLQRFGSERRILAALDHPDIARPVDAGVVPDGRPYLAMEYVEGERIDSYCRAHGSGLRERIELFIAACDAVDHAHRRLVIHRDLKPANLLVTAEGRVKLLDFGVAKLLHPDDMGADSTLTKAELRPLTPDYASPEQLRGETVTTSSDVYSLGVLLYELLTGKRPFDRASRPMAQWTRDLIDAEPLRPSATSEMIARSELTGDLDAVVFAALHPDPQRRYESPRALAEDLRRHLAGLPVRAREDSTIYRIRRFVGRHRIGVGIAAAFLVTVLAAAFLLVRQVERTEQERARAEHERAGAEQVVRLLIDLFELSNPDVVPEGDAMPVGAFVERAAENIDRLGDQPEVQVRAWLALAGIHAARSRLVAADSVLGRADLTLRRLPEPQPELALLVAQQRGTVWAWQGRMEEARSTLVEVVRAREASRDERQLASALHEYAQAFPSGPERDALLERAQGLAEPLKAEDPKLLATIVNARAGEHYERAEYVQAGQFYARAESLLSRVQDEDHPTMLSLRHNLAAVRSATGDFAAAEKTYRELLRSRARVLGDRSTGVAAAHNGLAVTLAQQGRHAEAEAHFRSSSELFAERLGSSHPRVALELRSLARAHELQGHWEAALREHERAHAVIVQAEGATEAEQAWYLASRIPALLALGQVDLARSCARRALALQGSGVSRRHADVLLASARALDEQREQLLEECYARRQEFYDEQDPRLAEIACLLGIHLAARGDRDRAQRLLEPNLPGFASWPLAFAADIRAAETTLGTLTGAGR